MIKRSFFSLLYFLLFNTNVNSQVAQNFHAELLGNITYSGKATIMLCDTNGIGTTYSNVEYFLVQVTDTNNNKVIGTTGEIIHGLPNSSAILNQQDFITTIWSILPVGYYNVMFEDIICKNNNISDENTKYFRVPGIKIRVRK